MNDLINSLYYFDGEVDDFGIRGRDNMPCLDVFLIEPYMALETNF
jgi:hypothetical protein